MLKKIKSSISFWIVMGYTVVIAVTLISTIFAGSVISNSKNSDNKITEVKLPLFYDLKDLNVLLGQTKNMTKNWVAQANEGTERTDLPVFLGNNYSELKSRIEENISKLEDDAYSLQIQKVLKTSDEIISNEKKIIAQLKSPEDYNNAEVLDQSFTLYENSIAKKTIDIQAQLIDIIKKQNIKEELKLAQSKRQESFSNINLLLELTTFITVIVAVIVSMVSVQRIVKPIVKLKDWIEDLGQGKIKVEKFADSENEIGQIALAVENLVEGLKNKADFATEIGQGNYDKEFHPLSVDDVLSNSLITMRNNLVSFAEEEKKRSWATEGMAKFGDILRTNVSSLVELSDNILVSLVRYINANQGGVFIVNDHNSKDVYLELLSCYAWDKKKFISKKIYEGEGLVGQSWQENDVIYITDVPHDYIKITSGLGGANPGAVLIVPLTVNDVTYGVLELASFYGFEDYQIEFVKKLAESIASTLSTAKINERTKFLLEQSQQQAEEMRAQEEEMRQNMEEMQATQEEMERKEIEMKRLVELSNSQEEQLRQALEEMRATQEETELKAAEQKAADEKTKKVYEGEINSMYEKWFNQLKRMEKIMNK